jgi:hypothetical protein
MRGPDGDPAWDHHASGAPGISKYLEFADIALGIKKPASKKKRPQSVHDVNKTEPYSGSR